MNNKTISDAKPIFMPATIPTAPTYISQVYPGLPQGNHTDQRTAENPIFSVQQVPPMLHQTELQQIEQNQQNLIQQQIQKNNLNYLGQPSQINQQAPETAQRSDIYSAGLQQHFINSKPVEATLAETAKVVVINNRPLQFGHAPQTENCPHCFERTQTFLKYRSTFRTHVVAMIFCITGLWCLAPLPYCINSCKRLDHHCSHCKQLVGKTMS